MQHVTQMLQGVLETKVGFPVAAAGTLVLPVLALRLALLLARGLPLGV